MRSYGPDRYLDYYDAHSIIYTRYYTVYGIQLNCQMHFIARCQVSSQAGLKHTPEHALKYTPNCTWWHSQPTWLYTSKYGLKTLSKYPPKYAPKYSPNYTRCHTPILLDYTLPIMLSRCSQVHSWAHSPFHSPEATHFQSHLTTCFRVCFWMLNSETGWAAGARHQEADGRWWEAWGGRQVADGGGWNHDIGWYHSLKLLCCSATVTRSHVASCSWYWQLQPVTGVF